MRCTEDCGDQGSRGGTSVSLSARGTSASRHGNTPPPGESGGEDPCFRRAEPLSNTRSPTPCSATCKTHVPPPTSCRLVSSLRGSNTNTHHGRPRVSQGKVESAQTLPRPRGATERGQATGLESGTSSHAELSSGNRKRPGCNRCHPPSFKNSFMILKIIYAH